MRTRAIPRVGDEVTVAYLSVMVTGVVAEVSDGLRSLGVLTEEGEALRFELNRATGRYLSGGGQSGARLLFAAR
jgi:hypothetical protein